MSKAEDLVARTKARHQAKANQPAKKATNFLISKERAIEVETQTARKDPELRKRQKAAKLAQEEARIAKIEKDKKKNQALIAKTLAKAKKAGKDDK